MADSTTNLDTISSSMAQKEPVANALFDAGSPATLYGRRAQTTTGLTWGYYGGVASLLGGLSQIANGTIALTASATNYIEADLTTGAVSKNTTGWTEGKIRLYEIIVGASTVTSYEDWRTSGMGSGSGGGSGRRVQSIAYASTVTLDCALYDVFEIGTLTGDITVNFTGAVNAQRIEVMLVQDATGGRSITWDTDVTYGGDLTSENTASAEAPNKTDHYGFRFHESSGKYRMIACARGY